MSKETKPDGGLTISSIDIKNFKRIKCVQFDPKEAGLTTLGGMNRAGKTSGINAIQMGFSGGKYRPTDIHNDQGGPGDLASVSITTTNGFKVRIFGKNGNIEVIDPAGKKGGITLFGDAVSSFATDLRPFINANATDKYKIAVLAMGIGDLLETIEAQRKTAFSDRTVANGIALKAKTVLDETVEPGKDVVFPEEVDIVELSAEIQKMNKDNTDRLLLISAKKELVEDLDELSVEEARLQEELKTVKLSIVDKQKDIKDYAPIPDEQDIEPLNAKMATANTTNAKRITLLKVQEDYDAKVLANKAAAQGAVDAQVALDEVIEKKNNTVTELGEISNPDITLEGGQLLYKGKAWDCISGAEELIVATEFGVATNKGCNFVLVDGLESMDPVERGKYDAWGIEHGVQLIGTVVTGDPEQCSIFIEDGQVKTEG